MGAYAVDFGNSTNGQIGCVIHVKDVVSAEEALAVAKGHIDSISLDGLGFPDSLDGDERIDAARVYFNTDKITLADVREE